MALLQITEPIVSNQPQRYTIGIDLGTTNSLVASVIDGKPVVLSDEDGDALLPSVVHYSKNNIQVGKAGLQHQSTDPHNTIFSVKRLMGRSFNELPKNFTAYELVNTPGMVCIKTISGIKNPVEVSAEILRSLLDRAQAKLANNLFGAVITVPAYFDDAQRQATKDAAHAAGIHVLRLINEPTAAAIAYGIDHESEGTYLVYDLGGGTLDVSILQLTQGIFKVLATSGDSMLGGDDFDQVILNWMLTQLDPSLSFSSQDSALLLQQARAAKEGLTHSESTTIEALLSTGYHFKLDINRTIFTNLSAHLLERAIQPLKRAMRDAKLAKKDIQGVIMVGGATRMPFIQSLIQRYMGNISLLNDLDPDRVVALGAAMQAEILAGNDSQPRWLLLDVLPLSLGLETMGGLVEKLIPRNSTLPIARSQDFTTFTDGQTAMVIHVLQGERELVKDCRSLARFELHGIPPLSAGIARIRVTFQVDANGLLSVSAQEQSTGIQAAIAVKPTYGLPDEEVARLLQEATQHAADDTYMRKVAEIKIAGTQLLQKLQTALIQDSTLLDSKERAIITEKAQHLEQVMQTTEVKLIQQAITELNEINHYFINKLAKNPNQASKNS